MAVLIERHSLVLRVEEINQYYPQGWDRFRFDIGGMRWCCDGDLVALSFTDGEDYTRFAEDVEDWTSYPLGEGHKLSQSSLDMIYVDQFLGPLEVSQDIGFAIINWANTRLTVAAAWLKRSYRRSPILNINEPQVAVPSGWVFEGSASAAGHLIRGSWDSSARRLH